MNAHIKIHREDVLSDDYAVLKKVHFDYQRRDGRWQPQAREVYDRGDGVAILLYNREEQTVILVRQFRLPVYVHDSGDGMLIEAAAGVLDKVSPQARIRSEAEEETGYRVRNIEKVFEAYMSPGTVTEKLHFFLGEYDPGDRGEGGGLEEEGEDIEVLELPFREAMAMITRGEIEDAKTILLLQYAALRVFSVAI